MRIALSILLFLSAQVFGQVVLTNMPRATWPYWIAGVPGGITNYPVYTNVVTVGAVGDGVTDDSAAFQNAVTTCSNMGAVFVPAGIYLLNSQIEFLPGKSVVLRGESPTNTILLSHNQYRCVYFHGAKTYAESEVTSGYTRGSSNLVVATPANITVGATALLYQSNDLSVVFGKSIGIPETDSDSSYPTNVFHMHQLFRVIAKDGDNITLDNPIYYEGYAAEFVPRLRSFTSMLIGCGVESLSISNISTVDQQHNIEGQFLKSCWVTNCNITNADRGNISLSCAYQCSVQGNSIWGHNVYDFTERHSVYFTSASTDNLIENNIGNCNNQSFCLQDGCGNVVAYNFTLYGLPTSDYSSGNLSHGKNCNYNLFEGNVAPYVQADYTWGSNRKETIFRNWLTCTVYFGANWGTLEESGSRCVWLGQHQSYMTAIGNIFGTPAYTTDGDNMIHFDASDATTWNTLHTNNNYDFKLLSLRTTNTGSLVLSNSYYLTSKPSWFGNLEWPAIGPDRSVMTNGSSAIDATMVIPAQARWYGQDYSLINPTVITLPVSATNLSTATLEGQVTAMNLATSYRYGFAYGGPVYEYTNTVGTTDALCSFSLSLINLTPNTLYYVKAFAAGITNAVEFGTNWGAEVNFRTITPAPPTTNTILRVLSPISGGPLIVK